MLIVLSPAKIMNFKVPATTSQFTEPYFLKEAGVLVKLLRGLTIDEFRNLLGINPGLTQLNFDRYFNWHLPFTLENAKQAMFAYDGEVFRGLSAKTMTEPQLDYAQSHLRILSGLYGLLRPLDLIQPYRLEVSSPLKNLQGRDLYAFWKEKVTKLLIEDMNRLGRPKILLNLASSEYFKTFDLKKTDIKVIHVDFYEYRDDKFKQIVIYTKKARGMMARFTIENRITQIEEIKGFSEEGYWFNPEHSTDDHFIFVR